jgi:hypothetical protein
MHVCRYTVADRSGNRSVGWKTGGTSVVVSAEYFWNSQTLIGVGHLPHRVHPKVGRAAVLLQICHLFASCDPEAQHLRVRFIAVRGRDRDRGFSKVCSSEGRSHAATV